MFGHSKLELFNILSIFKDISLLRSLFRPHFEILSVKEIILNKIPVASSKRSLIQEDTASRFDKISAREFVPNTFRREV